jgi:hypothetical protein
MVVTKRVIVPRTPAIGRGATAGTRMRGIMSGWGGTRRGTKDSTFFQGLSQSSSLECNVRGLPTAFGYLVKKNET